MYEHKKVYKHLKDAQLGVLGTKRCKSTEKMLNQAPSKQLLSKLQQVTHAGGGDQQAWLLATLAK